MKTWHYEYAVVIPILAVTAILSGNTLVAWISAIAVFASFGHASVADRMQEREAAREIPQVECYRKLTYYYVSKEVAWVSVFILTKTWPALIGCGIFLAYPIWRRWWRKRHPLSPVYKDHVVNIAQRDAIRARFEILLDNAMKERPARPAFVPDPNDTHDNPAWVLHERETMHKAINATRVNLGLTEIPLSEVAQVERSAYGHSDYFRKFALYCANLAVRSE